MPGPTKIVESGSPAPSVGQGWDVYPYMYEVKFSDEADSVTTPPDDPISGAPLSWAQQAALDAASTASGVLSLDHGVGNTSFATGPRLTASVPFAPGKGRAVAAFVYSSDLDESTEGVGVVIETAAGVNAAGCIVRNTGGQDQVQFLTDGGSIATVNIASGDVDAGVWVMLWQEYEFSAGIVTGAAYALGGTAAVPPALEDWSILHTSLNNDAGNATDTLLCGAMIKTANTSNTLTGDIGSLWLGWVS